MGPLILSTVLFYALHSILAMASIKAWAGRSPFLARWYRFMYSLVSVALLAWVAVQYSRVPMVRAFPATAASAAVGLLLVLVGGSLIGIALRQTGVWGFIGLRPERPTDLLRVGPYRHVRHPIYTGIIVAAIGWCLLSPTLPTVVVCLTTFCYLPLGIRHEETRLVQEFGAAYRDYRREVPGLWPRW